MTAEPPGSSVASDSAIPAPIQSSAASPVRFANGTIAIVSSGDPPESCPAPTGDADARTETTSTTGHTRRNQCSTQLRISIITKVESEHPVSGRAAPVTT